MIPTIPPTADELLAEIDRAHEEMFHWVEDPLPSWVEDEDEPTWLQALAVWGAIVLAGVAVWLVVVTAVSRVVRHLVAS